MCLRSTHGRIGSVHVVVKYEHCEKNICFHTLKRRDTRSLQHSVVGRYRKEKLIGFNGRFVPVVKYGIFSVTFGLTRIGFKLVPITPQDSIQV